MPVDVKLSDATFSGYASEYVTIADAPPEFKEMGKSIKVRNSAFGRSWDEERNSFTPEAARRLARYLTALADEVEAGNAKPRYEYGAIYASRAGSGMGSEPYLRQRNGWRPLEMPDVFFSDDDTSGLIRPEWLDSLVKLDLVLQRPAFDA